ncbi:MAG: hypothetical protein E6J43_07365 [Chloroflexi bacterium]|nr:MAG: hypothetical protein E6J43_07365 [Chloroflexota bacterium]
MGIKEWADRRVHKSDTLHAIEETQFQFVALTALGTSLSAVATGEIDYYISMIREGMCESEARLWGYRGNATEWTNSRIMIRDHGVVWDKDREQQLRLALILEIHRHYLERAGASSAERDPEQIRAGTQTCLRSTSDALASHANELEETALAEGVVSQRDLARIKARVGQRWRRLSR